jgi:hypothetical protein
MLVGSHNLTRESLDARREIGLVVEDPSLVARALDAVRRDVGTRGAPPLAPGRPPGVIESVLRSLRAARTDGGRPGWPEALFRLALAAALAAGTAYRPWRRFGLDLSWPTPGAAATQVLLGVAGAIVGLRVGEGPARALGLLALVGALAVALAVALRLAGVLRFEAGVRDARAARPAVPAGGPRPGVRPGAAGARAARGRARPGRPGDPRPG